MGNIRIFLLFLVLIFILCGCQKIPADKAAIGTEPATAESTNPEDADHLSNKENDFIHDAFSPTTPDEETTIRYGTEYPLIYSEEIDYSLVNSAIAKTIDDIVAQIKESTDEISLFTTDYAVQMQSSEYVSVLYNVFFNVEGSAHPVDMAFGINLDINGNTVQLHDFVTIDNQLAEDFKAAWNKQTIDELQDYLNTYSDETLLELLGKTDSLSSNVGFYLTENSIVILFTVPRAAGSYVSVALPKS